MKRAIIFLNGTHHNLKNIRKITPKRNDVIIAVDGGAKYCHKLNTKPNFVIGDMDSISPSLLEKFKKTKVNILTYPSQKNETDFELALDLAISKKVTELLIIGGVGNRLDMTLTNIFSLSQSRFSNLKIKALTDTEDLLFLRPGTTYLKGVIGNRLSLIPLTRAVTGVTLRGFQYTLNNKTIQFGSGRTISNYFRSKVTSIKIKSGVLICIITGQTN